MLTKKQVIRKTLDFMNAHLPQSELTNKVYYYLWTKQREPRKPSRVYLPAQTEEIIYPKAGEFF